MHVCYFLYFCSFLFNHDEQTLTTKAVVQPTPATIGTAMITTPVLPDVTDVTEFDFFIVVLIRMFIKL